MTLVGSLFSGIGGLDLGLERAGMTVRWQSEIDPYCCRVLAQHWPHVPNLGDIKAIDWKDVEPVDLICGGYPCQPFSLAGARNGTDDPRHLWPWMRDAVRHLRPRFVLLENVPGHLSMGFGRVLGDLAECGYDTEWDCIPAAAVGAPHLRYRVFVVAHAGSARRRQDARSAPSDESADAGRRSQDDHVPDGHGQSGRAGHVADTAGERRHRRTRIEGVRRVPPVRVETLSDAGDRGSALADAISPRLEIIERQSRDNGPQLSTTERGGVGRGWWTTEPDVGRVANGVPHRVDRLRALGNAVVPQVAEWVGRRIMEAAA